MLFRQLMTSIQMMAVNALLHNVTNFAQEAVRSPATEDFKANPSKDSMMNYLFNSILMKRRTVELPTSMFDRSCLADRDALSEPSSRANSRTRWTVSLPGPEEDEPQPATRPSRPRLGERQHSASQSWRQTGQRRTLAVQEDDVPAPLFRRTSTPTSSFSSRVSQWR